MKRKYGISLIVLAITIIVMIILASAVILTLNSSDIIDRANETTDATNANQIKQLATLAWSEAYVDANTTVEELQAAVNNALKDIDTSKYKIEVTEEGVKVTEKGDVNLELNKTEITKTISSGIHETVELVASMKNIEGELVWTSSNTSVATVTGNGASATVTLLSTGTATITVAADGLTANCTVNVKVEALVGQQFTFKYSSIHDLYLAEVQGLNPLENGKTYVVVWDGVEYICVARDRNYASTNTSAFGGVSMSNAVGNSKLLKNVFGIAVTTTDSDTGEPFLINYTSGSVNITTASTAETHTVRIYEKVN